MMLTNPDPELMRIFDFTAADLEANRAGQITKHQIDNQYKLLKGHNTIFLVGAIAIPVGFLLMLTLTGAFNSSSLITNRTDYWMVAVLSTTALLIFIMVKNNKNMASDVHIGVACCESGVIRRRTGRGEGYLKIAKRNLTLYDSQDFGLKEYLEKIPQETLFHVYYIPKSKRVIAMEIIE